MAPFDSFSMSAPSNEDMEIRLFHLSAQGDLDGVIALSEIGVNLHAADYNGRTALHIAAQRGHLDLVEYLLTKGLSPTVEDDNGISALSLAVEGGYDAVFNMLQEYENRIQESEEPSYTSEAEGHKRPSFAVMEAFPMPIALAMLDGKEIKQISKDPVSLFFSDIVGFTALSSEMDVIQVSNMLHSLFSKLDRLAYIHGVQKVDVIGDAYVAATNFTEDQVAKRIRDIDPLRDLSAHFYRGIDGPSTVHNHMEHTPRVGRCGSSAWNAPSATKDATWANAGKRQTDATDGNDRGA